MAIDLSTSTTLQVIAALDRGEVSSVEVLGVMRDRIERLNPALNAVVAQDLERAEAEAVAADDLYASGDPRGPLHGLPMTVKDTYETLDLVTTSGSPDLVDHVPTVDADAVRLLRRAGAIVWAKTNTPLFANDHQTYNEVYGVTNNPWEQSDSAGGSSGGSAVAVACGMSTAEVGSDIGGSIRQPAALNGAFGLKTSHGLVSGRGHIPGRPGTLTDGDIGVFGPIARSCGDLRLLLELLTTSTTAFGGVPGASLPRRERPVDVAELRIGVWSTDVLAPVDQLVRSVVEQAAADLEAAGALVDADIRPSVDGDALFGTYVLLLAAAMSGGMDPALFERLAADVEPSYGPTLDAKQGFLRGTVMPHRFWLRANEHRARAQVAWRDLFEHVDVVIAPVLPVASFAHDHERSYHDRTFTVNGEPQPYSSQLFWAGLASMPGLPALSIPAGSTPDGRPVGMQIIGPRWSDHELLAIGEEVASVLGARFTPPPIAR